MDPLPNFVFLTSTKFPTLVFDPIADCLCTCAKGPIDASLPIVTSVITLWLKSWVRSPIEAFTTRTPLWITQPAPITVCPSSDTPGWMTVSAPICTVSSM